MRRTTLWLALALIAGQALPALAQEGWSGLEDPISADRPDFTEGTGLIPPGHVQVEGGVTLGRTEDVDTTTLGELLVRFGIGERSEARIGLGSYTRIDDDFTNHSVSGFEDPAVELKYRFTDDAVELAPGQPAVALVLGTSIPVGDEELTADQWVPAAVLAFDWDLGRFGIGANLGGSHEAGDGDRFVQAFGSVTAGYSVTDRLGAYVEWYGFSEEEKNGPSTHYLDGGISFLINDDLIVDARIGTGLNDADPDWFAGVGGAIRF